MVNKHAFRCVCNQTVHKNLLSARAPAGVKIVTLFADTPFVHVQPIIILGVNDGKFTLSQRNEPNIVVFRERGSRSVLANVEIFTGILLPDDEEFALAAELVFTYKNWPSQAKRLNSKATILTTLS